MQTWHGNNMMIKRMQCTLNKVAWFRRRKVSTKVDTGQVSKIAIEVEDLRHERTHVKRIDSLVMWQHDKGTVGHEEEKNEYHCLREHNSHVWITWQYASRCGTIWQRCQKKWLQEKGWDKCINCKGMEQVALLENSPNSHFAFVQNTEWIAPLWSSHFSAQKHI